MNDLMFAKQYVKDTKPSGKESTIRDIGILGIFNYTYDNKYLFDASYRANASSQFGANNRWEVSGVSVSVEYAQGGFHEFRDIRKLQDLWFIGIYR